MEYKHHVAELGVDATYWNLFSIEYLFSSKSVRYTFAGYASKEALEKGAKPIASFQFSPKTNDTLKVELLQDIEALALKEILDDNLRQSQGQSTEG